MHPCLPTQFAVCTDLECDTRDLGRERRKLVHHGVDGVLELQHLALDIDGDSLCQIARGNSLRYAGDGPHLVRKIGRHDLQPEQHLAYILSSITTTYVDVISELRPSASHANDVRLATEFALRPDLQSDSRHFGSEARELPHHGIHRQL